MHKIIAKVPGIEINATGSSGNPLFCSLNYYRETDSLYIDLSSRPSVESQKVSEGIVLDYDDKGNIVGIDIDNASQKIDLREFILNKIPAELEALTA